MLFASYAVVIYFGANEIQNGVCAVSMRAFCVQYHVFPFEVGDVACVPFEVGDDVFIYFYLPVLIHFDSAYITLFILLTTCV